MPLIALSSTRTQHLLTKRELISVEVINGVRIELMKWEYHRRRVMLNDVAA